MDERPAILVLGGTGHFGRRISRRLASQRDIRLVISSRSAAAAGAVAREIGDNACRADIEGVALDQTSPQLVARLKALAPVVVIHTAGPYQGQDYAVARACIETGCHYVDLADGRSFVTGIGELDDLARAAQVSIVSGASTLPAVSAAVVDHLRARFNTIDSIETSIAPAHRTPRGIGTVRAVLSYCGTPVATWHDSCWKTVHGWQNLRWQRYPGLGRRLSAACDVPDLELFPERYAGVCNVSFHAALEAWWEQLSLWCMAALTRVGIVRNWTRWADRFSAISERFVNHGSDRGGMHVRVEGMSREGERLAYNWYLVAEQNHGPEIPCTPAVLLGLRIARRGTVPHGAYPCLGLLTIDDIRQGLAGYSVHISTSEEH